MCHDLKVDRTTNGQGRVRDLTLEELKGLDADPRLPEFAGQTIPTLEEVLSLLGESGWSGTIYLELKTLRYDYPGIEAALARALADFGIAERCVVNSFNHQSLVRMQAAAPGIRTTCVDGSRMVRPWDTSAQLGAPHTRRTIVRSTKSSWTGAAGPGSPSSPGRSTIRTKSIASRRWASTGSSPTART